jgi:hypothetical protein
VDLYPNPTAPLIPLYPNTPVGENRSRQNRTWCCVADGFKGGDGRAQRVVAAYQVEVEQLHQYPAPLSVMVA